MADNFNLRAFLAENKLTKNAKLLKEQEELSYPFGQFGQAVKDIFEYYNEEAISDAPDIVYEMIAELIEEYDLDPMSGEINTELMEARLLELYKAAQTMDTEKFGEFAYNELSDGSLFIGGDEDDLDENIVSEANYSDSYNTPAAKAVNAKANQIVKTIKGYKTALQTIQDAIRQVEQEVGSEVTRSERNTLENHLMWMFRREMEMERESVDNKKPVMENLTAKERRLVEMVQDALGITPAAIAEKSDEEHEFGTNAVTGEPLPDPASQMVAEDDMVQEKSLPKYENIEKLMQEIEAGTNEAAHSYKMKRMKEIAEMLEAKVGSLEEGEGAEFVDTKKVKQMKKDIMTLRKQAEKLEKEYDKKFGEKKSKKETQTESKLVNFNLKKFLVENKLTANSKMLKEEEFEDGEEEQWPDVQLSDDAREEIENVIKTYTPEMIKEDGTDIIIDIIAQAIEELDGYELPEGYANVRMDREIMKISRLFHSNKITLDHAVEKAVTAMMDPKNFED